jgi:CRP-like cAMP-binding protein
MGDRFFSKGEVVFKEGDSSDYAYIIKNGEVEITKKIEGSNETFKIATLGPGEVFGEMGIVSEKPRSASVTATADLTVSEVSYDDFMGILINKPHEGIKYLRVLFERLRETTTNIDIQKFLKENKGAKTNIDKVKKRLRLVPLSKSSEEKIGLDGKIIEKFPYRIGRLSSSDQLGINDLYLPDSKPYTVSRNHFSIDLVDGMFVFRDRGSQLGLIINEKTLIGGDSPENTYVVKTEKMKFEIGNRNSENSYRFGVIIETK